MSPLRYLLKGSVAAHWRQAPTGFVPVRSYTRHDPELPDAMTLGEATVGALKRMLREGAEGGKWAAQVVRNLLQAGKITGEQVEDTFGNGRMPSIAEQGLRRKPEVYQALVNRTEAGYRAFLEALGLGEGLVKAHVKAHQRKTKTGLLVRVRDYDNRRQKKVKDPGVGAFNARVTQAASDLGERNLKERVAYLEDLWGKDRDAFVGLVVAYWNEPKVWKCFTDYGDEGPPAIRLWQNKELLHLGVNLTGMFRLRYRDEVRDWAPSRFFEPKTIAQAATRQWVDGSRSFGAYLLGLAARDAASVRGEMPPRYDHQRGYDKAARLLEGTLFLRRTRTAVQEMRKEAQSVFQPGDYTLYRGVKQVRTRSCALESWSDDQEIAEGFDGGGVLQEELDPERILTWHDSQWWGGDGSEHEYVLLGERAA